jgi:hypothetical protein
LIALGVVAVVGAAVALGGNDSKPRRNSTGPGQW